MDKKKFQNAYSFFHLETFQTDWIWSQKIPSYVFMDLQFLAYLEGLHTIQKNLRNY